MKKLAALSPREGYYRHHCFRCFRFHDVQYSTRYFVTAHGQEAAQPVYQYKQIELNHSHIIGIPAVILRYKQWREQKRLLDAEIEHQQLLNEQLRQQIEREKRDSAARLSPKKAKVAKAKDNKNGPALVYSTNPECAGDHSVAKLRKHYWEVVDKETVKRYSNICPTVGSREKVTLERRSRWAVETVVPTKVVEVRYDHFSHQRFRHGCTFLRVPQDKLPKDCLLEQVVEHPATIHRDPEYKRLHRSWSRDCRHKPKMINIS